MAILILLLLALGLINITVAAGITMSVGYHPIAAGVQFACNLLAIGGLIHSLPSRHTAEPRPFSDQGNDRAGSIPVRHWFLFTRANRAQATDELRRLLETAIALENLSPDERPFIDRHLGELDQLARRLDALFKGPESAAGARVRDSFEASVREALGILTSRRET